MEDYEPPRDIWQVNASLRFDEPLDGDKDPRWVDTRDARGDDSLARLTQVLGIDMAASKMRRAPERGYYLFCGHRGSGKSTELRHIRNQLHKPDIYHVVLADAALELDVNNLRYQDILLHLAAKLADSLADKQVSIDPVHLRKLDDWFTERVESQSETKAFALDAKAGIGADLGILRLAKVFARISTTFKTNTTYKEELRRTLRNYFSDFAEAFNALIKVAEEKLGQRILFIVDGTDRLREDDARAFFIADVHQLQQIHGRFIYCAPVHLTYEQPVKQVFNGVFHLPMIRVEEKDGSPNQCGLAAMGKMLLRRAHQDLFDDGVVDHLIQYCGGHPRDLLRLLQSAFSRTVHGRFNMESVHGAVGDLSTDFRRILRARDYRILARIDCGRELEDEERTNWLLYNLALLEYNGVYWRSHPAVRETEGYRKARESLAHS